VTAETVDGGIIMGIRHRELPIEAIQFHPESILTLTPGANYGLQLIENAVRLGKRVRVGAISPVLAHSQTVPKA
jgi:anthranilate/para-aminobenzoate synthase component II